MNKRKAKTSEKENNSQKKEEDDSFILTLKRFKPDSETPMNSQVLYKLLESEKGSIPSSSDDDEQFRRPEDLKMYNENHVYHKEK